MIVNVFIPAIVVLLMVVVGTGLRVDDFRSVLRSPVPLIGGTLSQVLLLPIGALIIVFMLDPAAELAGGLLLVAACPGGALSNYYCYLGRLNVPLSVLLTAMSSVLSFVMLPLVLALTFPIVTPTSDLAIPVSDLARRLFLFLLLPIGFGMALRHYFPDFVVRHAHHTRYISLGLLIVLLALIMFDQWERVWRLSLDAAVLAILFTGFAASIGWGSGLVVGLSRNDRYVFSVEFAIRNVGAAALVAASTLARPEFLAFGALFVVFQFPLMLSLLYFCHWAGLQRSSKAAGTNNHR